MRSVTILAVHYSTVREMFEVVKEIIHDDGTVDMNLHQFPAETLEWKAAEYGIRDPDTLIDLILFEPFTEPVDVLKLQPSEALAVHLPLVRAAKKNLQTSAKGRMASAATSLRTLGVHQKYIDAVTEDPNAVIKEHAPFDPEVIVVREAYLAQVRTKTQEAERESPVKVRPSGAVRATRERARLFRQENMRREGDRNGDRRGG